MPMGRLLNSVDSGQWTEPAAACFRCSFVVRQRRQNLNFCLVTNEDERIQKTKVSSETLEPIAQQAEANLRPLRISSTCEDAHPIALRRLARGIVCESAQAAAQTDTRRGR